MTPTLDQIRANLAQHDTVIVKALAHRALLPTLPPDFYDHGSKNYATLSNSLPGAVADFGADITDGYLRRVVPALLPASSVAAAQETDLKTPALEADRAAVCAIATRLTLSLQVAAIKLGTSNDSRLRTTAATGDLKAVAELITFPSIEQLVLLRVRSRTAEYVRTHVMPPAISATLPTTLHAIYADWLIPLSRAIQAAWLCRTVAQSNT